jgi:Muconolactone delta-isomerase
LGFDVAIFNKPTPPPMSQFMVELTLPNELTEEFLQIVPRHRLKINELMERGKINSYALAADRSKVWCIVKAESEFEVMDIIAQFPLIDYLTPSISELMFNNAVALRLPLFTLN